MQPHWQIQLRVCVFVSRHIGGAFKVVFTPALNSQDCACTLQSSLSRVLVSWDEFQRRFHAHAYARELCDLGGSYTVAGRDHGPTYHFFCQLYLYTCIQI